MGPKKFTHMSRKYFGELLLKYGFSATDGDSPVFYRINQNDIYHIIFPMLGSRGVWFDLSVLGHSPILKDTSFENFPESVQDVTGGFSYLHPITGVGPDQKCYRCRTEEGFIRNFNQEAKPALEKFGLPYLDKLQTIDDVIATIPEGMRPLYNIPNT